jgi:hypothetical protein
MGIIQCSGEELKAEWRKLYDEEQHNSHYSSNIRRKIKEKEALISAKRKMNVGVRDVQEMLLLYTKRKKNSKAWAKTIA